MKLSGVSFLLRTRAKISYSYSFSSSNLNLPNGTTFEKKDLGSKREEKGSIKRRGGGGGRGENRPCYSNEFEAMKVRASVWPLVLLPSCEYRS